MLLRTSDFVSIANEAEELEKKFEWLQASKCYKKIFNLAIKNNDVPNQIEFLEKAGFCFYRAALQANTNFEFKKLLNESIQIYEAESKIIKNAKKINKQMKLNHVNALVAYNKSFLEKERHKWKCLECKGIVTCHGGMCLKCGFVKYKN